MEQPKNKSAFKILIVEDNLLDFELMEAAIETQISCDVHLVVTKDQFEEELAQKKPDLIVSDSNMAGFDGLAALTLAGERCPDVPFVFCSGAPSKDPMKAQVRPDVAWVSKQDGFAGLVDFVKKTLDSKKQ